MTASLSFYKKNRGFPIPAPLILTTASPSLNKKKSSSNASVLIVMTANLSFNKNTGLSHTSSLDTYDWKFKPRQEANAVPTPHY